MAITMSGIYSNTQAVPLPILNGGTGQSTAQQARNALLPPQGAFGGQFLTTDGSNVTWAPATGGSVTSVNVAVNNGITISGNPITTSGTLTFGLGNVAPTGSITFANGEFILGDFTTLANRPMFQSNVTDGKTLLQVVPNGTSTESGITFENGYPDVDDEYLMIDMNDTRGVIGTFTRGAGVGRPLSLVANNLIGIAILATGDVMAGMGSQSTTATKGFFQVPTTAGTPTGIPATVIAGHAPMQVDTTGEKIWEYVNGTWKYATLT